jgi:hypothetical protein
MTNTDETFYEWKETNTSGNCIISSTFCGPSYSLSLYLFLIYTSVAFFICPSFLFRTI